MSKIGQSEENIENRGKDRQSTKSVKGTKKVLPSE